MALNRYEQYSQFFTPDAKESVKGVPASVRVDGTKDKAKEWVAMTDQKHYAGELYPDFSQIDQEADALYQIFLDSQHDRDALEAAVPQEGFSSLKSAGCESDSRTVSHAEPSVDGCSTDFSAGTPALEESSLIDMLAFTSQLLVLHYKTYDKKNKVEIHEKRLNAIKHFIENHRTNEGPKAPESMENRFKWILKQVTDNFETLIKMVCQPSVLRDQLGEINLARIFWVFYHFSINQMISMVKDAAILDKIAQVLGRPIDLEAFYNTLNMPNDVLNIFSVAFFGLRLVVDVILLIKHTCRNEGDTTPWNRFCSELDKRISNMTNCVVWGGINSVTNYSQFFGLPAPFIMPLVAGVLTFDLARAYHTLRRNDSQYDRTIASLRVKINFEKENKNNSEYLAVLEKMEEVLLNKQSVEYKVFYFNLLSASIMFVAFATSLVVSPAGAVLACYLIGCMSLGMASCASPEGGDYSKYVTASRNLAYAQGQKGKFNNEQILQLSDKVTQEFNHLVSVIVERTFVPLTILVIFSVNPLAGLAVTLAYVGYKINQAYNRADKEKKEPPIPLTQFSLFESAPKNAEVEREEVLPTGDDLSKPEAGCFDCSRLLFA